LQTVSRRFPPPWTVQQQPACFVVRDHGGQALSNKAPPHRDAAGLWRFWPSVVEDEGHARFDAALREREVSFLKNMASSRTCPSQSQEKWLNDVAARIRRAA